jgi:hypothetical protein
MDQTLLLDLAGEGTLEGSTKQGNSISSNSNSQIILVPHSQSQKQLCFTPLLMHCRSSVFLRYA